MAGDGHYARSPAAWGMVVTAGTHVCPYPPVASSSGGETLTFTPGNRHEAKFRLLVFTAGLELVSSELSTIDLCLARKLIEAAQFC